MNASMKRCWRGVRLHVSGWAVACIAWFAAPVLGGYVAVDLYPLIPPSNFGGAGVQFDKPEVAVAGQVVGAGNTGNIRAVLWRADGSPVDLSPSSVFADSFAFGTSGSEQVGEGIIHGSVMDTPHAVLWHGNADSLVDLNPQRLPGVE